jgi:septal ring-binding cell division protein DamX
MKITEILQSLSDAQVQYVLVGGSLENVLVRPDLSFDRLIANAVMGELFGRRVPIASIDDLHAMKHIANRSKDQLDIAALEKIKRGEDPNG